MDLVKNSIYALEAQEDPVIQLRAYKLNERVVIEESDNGKGISDEILGHIFTPFFTTRKDGSGIGLSLARQVMQMHNGTIDVMSEEGEYTTFSLSF